LLIHITPLQNYSTHATVRKHPHPRPIAPFDRQFLLLYLKFTHHSTTNITQTFQLPMLLPLLLPMLLPLLPMLLPLLPMLLPLLLPLLLPMLLPLLLPMLLPLLPMLLPLSFYLFPTTNYQPMYSTPPHYILLGHKECRKLLSVPSLIPAILN
jgi:hypothetical protein